MTQIRGTQVSKMFASIARRYDLTNSVLSFGLHHLWRFKSIARLGSINGLRALDLCTGTGDFAASLAKGGARVVALDFCRPMLTLAKEKLSIRNLNAALVEGDALKLPFQDGCFDLVTIGFGVRNFENLSDGLSEIYRVLAPHGMIVVLEFGQPHSSVFRRLYDWYSKHIIPRVGSLLTGNRTAYTYLPKTSKEFLCGENFSSLLKEIGFVNAKHQALSYGISFLYTASKQERRSKAEICCNS